jgi:hypothetical protein
LIAVQEGEFDDDTPEPAVPSRLKDLSSSLGTFINFMCIDPELVDVTAERSGKALGLSLSKEESTRWIAELSAEEKDGLGSGIIDSWSL